MGYFIVNGKRGGLVDAPQMYIWKTVSELTLNYFYEVVKRRDSSYVKNAPHRDCPYV
jgi:hypothetical protein